MSFSNSTPTSMLTTLLAQFEPKDFILTIKHHGWVVAMDDKLKALRQNHMLDLIPLPLGVNIVDSKSTYQTKYLLDGSINVCFEQAIYMEQPHANVDP